MQFAVERGEMTRFSLLVDAVVVAVIVGTVAVIVAAASFSHTTPTCSSVGLRMYVVRIFLLRFSPIKWSQLFWLG